MISKLAYIGPGLGLGSIFIVGLILLIVMASLGVIIWISIKKFFRKRK